MMQSCSTISARGRMTPTLTPCMPGSPNLAHALGATYRRIGGRYRLMARPPVVADVRRGHHRGRRRRARRMASPPARLVQGGAMRVERTAVAGCRYGPPTSRQGFVTCCGTRLASDAGLRPPGRCHGPRSRERPRCVDSLPRTGYGPARPRRMSVVVACAGAEKCLRSCNRCWRVRTCPNDASGSVESQVSSKGDIQHESCRCESKLLNRSLRVDACTCSEGMLHRWSEMGRQCPCWGGLVP